MLFIIHIHPELCYKAGRLLLDSAHPGSPLSSLAAVVCQCLSWSVQWYLLVQSELSSCVALSLKKKKKRLYGTDHGYICTWKENHGSESQNPCQLTWAYATGLKMQDRHSPSSWSPGSEIQQEGRVFGPGSSPSRNLYTAIFRPIRWASQVQVSWPTLRLADMGGQHFCSVDIPLEVWEGEYLFRYPKGLRSNIFYCAPFGVKKYMY